MRAPIWQRLQAAKASPLTREQVIEHLTASLRRNVNYLARRERRGRQTASDEALERDMEAIARAMVLLAGREGQPTSEPLEEALRRQTFIRAMGLVFVGAGSCPGCGQKKAIFSKRQATPGPGKERCLDCWRAER